MTIIDLGELRREPAPEPPAGPPRAVTRPYRVLAVLVAVLFALAGGAPLPKRSAVVVPAGLGADAFLAGDRLYLVDPPGRGGDRWLVAYRIPARGPLTELWRTALPASRGIIAGLLEQGGRVLVSGTVGGPDGPFRTVTFDARTGRPGWQLPGFGYRAGDGLLLVTADATGGGAIQRVDPATGRARWTVPTPAGGADLRFGPTGVDRIVLITTSGAAEVRDAVTGARLAARDVRADPAPAAPGPRIAGDLLVAMAPSSGTITGYGLDRLDLRWTAALPAVAYVSPCGDLVCAYRQREGMWALDPATGAVRWSNPHWQAVVQEGAGRFLVMAPGSGVPRLAVVAAATGRLVADLGNWELANGNEPGDRLIGVRHRDGRLFVAELDLAAGRARVLDALPEVLLDCRTGRDVLVCRRSDGAFGLWRLP